MKHTEDSSFWQCLDELLIQSKIIIDRPKGSAHPLYSQIVYELDYGYLESFIIKGKVPDYKLIHRGEMDRCRSRSVSLQLLLILYIFFIFRLNIAYIINHSVNLLQQVIKICICINRFY